jgi:Fur family peroxide stress response transcriptional regulator
MKLKNTVSDSKKMYDIFRRFKLKITPQRTAVYETLKELDKDHPSADRVYQRVRERIPSISYDTVNRILLKFAEIGLIDVVEGHGGPRRFDPDKDIHHHFHCIQCGGIIDFPSIDCDNIQIPDSIESKNRVLSKRVVLTGICDSCLKQKNRQ